MYALAQRDQYLADDFDPLALTYACEEVPGYRRILRGNGFEMLDPAGEAVRDPRVLRRIQLLAIPSSWNEVWICSSGSGHIQATGRDARNRKQTIYHPLWMAQRDDSRFDRLPCFGQALPAIRSKVERDLLHPGLSKEKLVAAVVHILETAAVKAIGRRGAQRSSTFGSTTFENRHAIVRVGQSRVQLKTKSEHFHELQLGDRKLVDIMLGCHQLPGQRLFSFLDQSFTLVDVGSSDINDYLSEVTGRHFAARDIVAWAATIETIRSVRELKDRGATSIQGVVAEVAGRLGKAPSDARKQFIHPAALTNLANSDWVRCDAGRHYVQGLMPIEVLALEEVL